MSQSNFHFALCVNNDYAQYIAVTIKSICENHINNSISIHILTDYIAPPQKNILQNIVKSYNKNLIFHEINDSSLKGLKETWKLYAWYRILIPHLLHNTSRCLYLDADTIVTDNLTDLFSQSMGNSPIGFVLDIENFSKETRDRCGLKIGEYYGCSGVMLMNLDYWRQVNLTEFIIRWSKENNNIIKFPDQDTLNILCRNNKIMLPIKYGLQPNFFDNYKFFTGSLYDQLLDAYRNPKIIHYAGCAPWIAEYKYNILHDYWQKYNSLLPHKIRPHFITKGINGVKVKCWHMFHPYNKLKDKLLVEQNLNLK